MKVLTTRLHGLLDYFAVIALAAAPRFFEIGERVTPLLIILAGATLIYSLLTDYEWGAVRVIPMPSHLALDASCGVFLVLLGALFIDELPIIRVGLVAFGLLELAAAGLTRSEPVPSEARPANARLPFGRRTRGF